MRRTIIDSYNGEQIVAYEIENEQLSCTIMNFGAAVLELKYNGRDVVLAHEHFKSYLDNGACLGVVVLPNANRTGNASYKLNGVRYQMEVNEHGHNNLHSSLSNGAHKRIWNIEKWERDSLTLSLHMKDGELGFAGNRVFKVTYSLQKNMLMIQYEAESDKDTVFNPTNHSYFNLNGHDCGNVMDHLLMINADSFTPYDNELICTGEIRKVEGTPFDFRKPHTLKALWDLNDEQMGFGKGYDHNFVLNKEDSDLCFVLKSNESGITMKCYTDFPGVQVYTGNYLDEHDGKKGCVYGEHAGVALETQYFPNSLNIEQFEKPVLKAGEHKLLTTRYLFSVDESESE